MHELLPQLRGAAVPLDLDGAAAAKSMWAFDDAAIAPMMGCPGGAAQYYEQASCAPLLPRVRVPLLFVSAKNDPIAPAHVVDRAVFTADGQQAPLLLAATAEGGHSMLWPEGWRGRGRSWSCAVLVEWVAALSREQHARL